MSPAQLRAANPFPVMTLIPLFTWGVFPFLERRGLEAHPAQEDDGGDVRHRVSRRGGDVQTFVDRVGAPPSALWQLPQYVLLTVGEVLVSVTGLEFSYTQAPKTMRSTIMSLWLLAIALGNLLAAVLTRVVSLRGRRLPLDSSPASCSPPRSCSAWWRGSISPVPAAVDAGVVAEG